MVSYKRRCCKYYKLHLHVQIEKSVRGLNVYVLFARKNRLAIQLQSEEKMVVF